jgi:hypothetical protein
MNPVRWVAHLFRGGFTIWTTDEGANGINRKSG